MATTGMGSSDWRAGVSQPWFEREPHALEIGAGADIARHTAHLVVEVINQALATAAFAVLVPSAGKTLMQTFAVLRESYRTQVDWQRVIGVQMDEYANISCDDPASFAHFIRRELIDPLQIGQFIHYYDATGRARGALDAYEQRIRDLGGIDCALHGVGRNGHVGFNEPGSRGQGATRYVELCEVTQRANGVSFGRGVTLGLTTLKAARCSIVVMLGKEKQAAAQLLLHGPMGPDNPVAALRKCARVAVFLDHHAAEA